MINNQCPNCGASNPQGSHQCAYCGTFLRSQNLPEPPQGDLMSGEFPQNGHGNSSIHYTIYNFSNSGEYQTTPGYNLLWPIRSQYVAAILAFLLGTFGVQKFYLRQYGLGFLFLLLCGTGIPTIIGFIDCFRFLFMNPYDFQRRYHVRSM